MADDLEGPAPKLELQIEHHTVRMTILDSRQVLPEHSAVLDDAMRDLAQTGDVALLPVAADALRTVHPSVAPTWIRKIGMPQFRLRAIAVVTSRSAVRVVANGVGQAARLVGSPLALQVFRTEPEARSWLKERGFLE